ncbi:hypothetical protein SAMN02787142_2532 [Burkholderia sp. WP9]|uniref:DUF6875 domain-containing protein n=1 Tax=Burkholderia sp. WP9 TaxID=1500263 RepID=UPI00089C7C7A|nr:hypothetical protein [Burkholderia sp. WP9]SED08947.1 hypothetical protein SAMN02787142_2532 [Burkholderia sp. WP9]
MIDISELDLIQGATARALLEIERSICPSTEIDSISDAPLRATFGAGLAWIQRFIMQPHPDLGRRGPVCPFARPAHEARAMHFCALDVGEMSFDVFIDVMMRLTYFFNRVAGNISGRSDLLSLCVFPRNLREESYYKFIDCAHSMLKPFYMNAGLMLGEFHPLSAVRGAHSQMIFPMRSDVPIFVIRSIASHDISFIDRQSGALGIRIHELECYLRGVGDLLPPSEATRIEDRIEELKSKLLGNEDFDARQTSAATALGLLTSPSAGATS